VDVTQRIYALAWSRPKPADHRISLDLSLCSPKMWRQKKKYIDSGSMQRRE